MTKTAMQFRRILFPVDFSEHSEACLERTLALADGEEVTELHYLYVLHTPTDFSSWSGNPTRDVQQHLETVVERFRPRGPGVPETAVRTGHASTEICRYATERECDLIVMATHGRTGLAHMLLGSTAEQVVRHAPCPVLSLRVQPDQIKPR